VREDAGDGDDRAIGTVPGVGDVDDRRRWARCGDARSALTAESGSVSALASRSALGVGVGVRCALGVAWA
jgi:hypothetical protein